MLSFTVRRGADKVPNEDSSGHVYARELRGLKNYDGCPLMPYPRWLEFTGLALAPGERAEVRIVKCADGKQPAAQS